MRTATVIRRLLIANRGEIAARIIRTCQRLGIEAVLGASEADLASVPARLADQVVRLGPSPAAASYLNVDAVVAAARAVGADAVHPGYGFLSESPRLAQACERAGIVFVGPTAEQLAVVGDKLAARRHARDSGLPVVPGGEVRGTAEALALAEQLGWPVLVKAAGGGGGRGMRLVTEAAEIEAALETAAAEASVAFGDTRLYLERYVSSGRHVEVQILADGVDAVHLGDRDCSIQRRYQKLVEEAPAPGLDEQLRSRMHQAAVAFARRLGYRGAGTVEFLVETGRAALRPPEPAGAALRPPEPAGSTFYFLEMNARIQVEHPVTEAITVLDATGLDLVAEQIAVAEGLPLRIAQDAVVLSGHAIECRINCEDWLHDFRPSPGMVTRVAVPVGPGLRVDTFLQAGDEISPYYDSLVAKLIASGRDRAQALERLRSALRRFVVEGVATTVPMHLALTEEPEFVAGGVDTTWFARFLQRRGATAAPRKSR
ncbi:MAG TPA: biotin carboxylase N-terminal domain-containing protein [Micromonosporaceae bacterium]|jgi:acetyl-CoA carboxylase biotin carboxylase subunit